VSKPRVVPDIERTAKMLDLVRESYPTVATGISHVVVEDVAPGTGWNRGNRWADVLVLSVNTVKRHVYNICGKLGVQSRTQAVIRARALNLL